MNMRPARNGILLIDKPAGMSSAKAVAVVKRVTGSKRVGHTGTLDPLATGLLICCLNQATRLARFLLTGEKQYEATLRLGISTDTQDQTGMVIAHKPYRHILKNELEAAFGRFIGPISQQPPIYSAVKHRGKPLYHYARKGKPVAKPPRPVVITALTLGKVTLPDVQFSVTCSAGTYIRTLCADIGDVLGTGGHLLKLHRTACSGFSVENAATPDQLNLLGAEGKWQSRLIQPADALADMPMHQTTDILKNKIRFGQPLGPEDGLVVRGKHMKMTTAENALLAIIDDAHRYMCVFPDGI